MDFSDNFNKLVEKTNDLSQYSIEDLEKLIHESEDIQKQYKNLQLVVKADANSLYGVSASIYFSLHDTDIAEDICMTGKHFAIIVDRAINMFFVDWGETELKIIQQFYPNVISLRNFTEYKPDTINDLCVYGDTDSRYVDLSKIYSFLITNEGELKLPDSDNELADFGCFITKNFFDKIIKETIEKDCDYRNARKGYLRMNHEVTTRKCIFQKKKKYILTKIWEDGLILEKPKLKFQGVELKKGGSSPRIKKILSKLVHKYLLEKYDIDMLRIECIKLLKYIKSRKEKDFIYSITSVSGLKNIKKNSNGIWESDKNHIQIQIVLSWLNFLEENKLTGEYKPAFEGQKMNYYYTNDDDKKVIGVPDDVDINNVQGLPEPDWNRMINTNLLKPLLKYIYSKEEIEDEDIEHFLLGVKGWNF